MNTTDYLLQNHVDSAVALITPKTKYTYEELKKIDPRINGRVPRGGGNSRRSHWRFGKQLHALGSGYLAAMKIGAIAVPFATTLLPKNWRRK